MVICCSSRGIMHKGFPVFILLLDIFAGAVAQLIVWPNSFTWVNIHDGARLCMWMQCCSSLLDTLSLITFLSSVDVESFVPDNTFCGALPPLVSTCVLCKC